jgi:hypothetical protein
MKLELSIFAVLIAISAAHYPSRGHSSSLWGGGYRGMRGGFGVRGFGRGMFMGGGYNIYNRYGYDNDYFDNYHDNFDGFYGGFGRFDNFGDFYDSDWDNFDDDYGRYMSFYDPYRPMYGGYRRGRNILITMYYNYCCCCCFC